MAEKRRQRSAESDDSETQQKQVSKRAKNNNNNHSTIMNNNGRPQHNQKMAQAALARIKKFDPTQKSKTTTTTNITNSNPTPPLSSSSSSPQSSSSSNPTINPTNTQDEQPNLSNLDNHPTNASSAIDLQQQIKNLKDQIENINQTVSTYKEVVENQTNLIDSIKSSLSCNICLEVLDSPYTLLCGHIFCHKDLYAWFHRTNPSSDHYDSDIHEMDDDDSHDEPRFANQREDSIQIHNDSSDSESGRFQFNQNQPSSRASANGTHHPHPTNLVGLMREAGPGRTTNPANLRPISMQRRRRNLICPQCRAAVIRRPTQLYAVKEAADKLKTISTPGPSSSCPTGSFRNLVEQHRDEKDLTWGQLFESGNDQDHLISNIRRDAAERRHVVVDLEDGVRRCSRCAWEIGNSGLCEGCGTRYASLDTDESDDESYRAQSDSEDMGTNYETEEEPSGEDEVIDDRAAYFWSRPIGRVFPVDSGSDDGDSMARMVSGIGDSDDSSDVQVVRRRRHVLEDSDSDVEAQPSQAARRRAAEERPRRASSSAEVFSSSPHSDRPHYSPSNHRDDRSLASSTDEGHRSSPVYRTGIAIAHGRIISSEDGYSSTQSEPGSPLRPTAYTPDSSSDGSHSNADDHASQSSADPSRSDDDDDSSDRSSHISSDHNSFHSDDDVDDNDDDHDEQPEWDSDPDFF